MSQSDYARERFSGTGYGVIKREQLFQTEFNKYLRAKKLYGVFELKQTTTNYFLFDEVKPHQVDGLLATQDYGFVHKISDLDVRIKAFDCVSTPPLPGYVVIKYPGCFFVITITAFLNAKDRQLRKSRKTLSKEGAEKICHLKVIHK